MPLDIPGPSQGDAAPAFSLASSGGERVSLADYRSRNLILVFFRGAW